MSYISWEQECKYLREVVSAHNKTIASLNKDKEILNTENTYNRDRIKQLHYENQKLRGDNVTLRDQVSISNVDLTERIQKIGDMLDLHGKFRIHWGTDHIENEIIKLQTPPGLDPDDLINIDYQEKYHTLKSLFEMYIELVKND